MSDNPPVSLRLTAEGANLLCVLTAVILVLWGMRSLKRLYRALRVRTAMLTGRLVHIRAVGSSLPFFEGATQAHVDAIVHTRQSYPPLKIQSMYVPYKIKEVTLREKEAQKIVLSLNIWVATTCRVWIVSNFHTDSFKEAFMASIRNESLNHSKININIRKRKGGPNSGDNQTSTGIFGINQSVSVDSIDSNDGYGNAGDVAIAQSQV